MNCRNVVAVILGCLVLSVHANDADGVGDQNLMEPNMAVDSAPIRWPDKPLATNDGYVPPPPGPYVSSALSQRSRPHANHPAFENAEEPKMSQQSSPLMRQQESPWMARSNRRNMGMPAYGGNYPSTQMPDMPNVQGPYGFNYGPVNPMGYYGNNNTAYGYPHRNGRPPQMHHQYMTQQNPVWNNFNIPMSNHPRYTRRYQGPGAAGPQN